MTTPDPRPVNPPGTDPTLAAPGPGSAAPSSGAVTGSPPRSTVAGPDTGPPSGQTARPRHTGRAIGRTLALALLVFVTVVLVLFVIFNTQTVDISLVFTDVNAPLVLALVIAAILGGLIAFLFNALMAVRGRRRNR